jgi:putative flippase GtrA
MDIQIDAALKRARGYWFIDGFIEMAAGGLFVILAGILLFSGYVPQTSFSGWFLSVTSEIVIAKLIGILIAVLILWWLKDRFTYPRTGFVRGKRVTVTQVLVIIRNAILFLFLPILVLLAASLLITSARNVLASMPAWFPVGLGLIWGGMYSLAGEWMGLHRFRSVAVMMVLTGIAIGFWQFTIGLPTFPSNIQSGIFQPNVLETIHRTLISLGFLILISGVTLMISGLVTFLRYRKENPTPYAEES